MEHIKGLPVRFLSIIMLCILSLTLCYGQSERSLIRDGNNDYKENKFTDAEVHYRKALEKNKELKEGAFNLGDALYKQGRFDEAAEQYRLSSEKHSDENIKAQAYHNIGNALLKGEKFPESIAAYKDALKLNPHDADTKYNLEYAKALLKQQQQQQNKDDKKNDKKDDKQKQDQQKQNDSKQDQQKQDDQQEKQKKEQEKQQQAQQQQDQQKQTQQKKQQISKEDAERILEALKNEEKGVQKKLRKKAPARMKVEKDW